jgi:xanthine/CO dehydrogenase XdhC/CoxF family maturation factor
MHFEIKRILEAFGQIHLATRKVALATVVNLHGSSYRRPGARMLVSDDGRWTGAISGGCLEGDALRQARKAMQAGKPMLVTYDTREEGNSQLKVALGCNGIIDVLIEPIDPSRPDHPIAFLQQLLENPSKMAVVATVYRVAEGQTDPNSLQPGDRLLVDYTGQEIASVKGKNLYNLLTADIQKVLESGRSMSNVYEMFYGEAEIFLEAVLPPIRLVIFGGGYDAAPLAQLAHTLGWQVEVTDHCVAHLLPKRFPHAQLTEALPAQFLERVSPDAHTAVVLMSHDYHKDLAILQEAIQTHARYIGVLGPKKRGMKMREDLQKMGIGLTESQEARFFNPMGLDIGAETPEEIAVSVIGEIQAVFSGREGGMLKKRQGHIHERTVYGDVPAGTEDGINYACSLRPASPDA